MSQVRACRIKIIPWYLVAVADVSNVDTNQDKRRLTQAASLSARTRGSSDSKYYYGSTLRLLSTVDMAVLLRFEHRRNAIVGLCRSSVTCLIVFPVLIFITISTVEKSQFLITRQIPTNDIVRSRSHLKNNTYIDSDRINIPNEDISISDPPDEDSTVAIETPPPTASVFFPPKPLFNIYSILNQSIGPTLLQHPNDNPLRNCSPTVQFQLHATIINNINHIETIEYTIQAMRIKNYNEYSDVQDSERVIPKLVGGDEIYVEWVSSDDPNEMGVAMISDDENGTYRLKFVRPPILQQTYTERARTKTTNIPPKHSKNIINSTTTQIKQNGRLTLYYDYTCGIGNMFAPQKDRFRRAGEIHLSFHNSNVPKPYIHDFVPPNSDIQAANKNKKGENSNIDLSKYHTIVSFGDSVMMQLVRQFTKPEFWSPNLHYRTNMCQCLSSKNDTKMALQKFNRWHGEQIMNATAYSHNQTVAVIIGSAVWDAMRGCVRSDFEGHRTSIRQFVSSLRSIYPQIDFYWKSPSALMLHRRGTLEDFINNTVSLQNSRYISDGIIRKMNAIQKELMQELHVPFLDLFDAYYLSAPWSLPGDSRHFEDELSSLLLSYYWPGLNRTHLFHH